MMIHYRKYIPAFLFTALASFAGCVVENGAAPDDKAATQKISIQVSAMEQADNATTRSTEESDLGISVTCGHSSYVSTRGGELAIGELSAEDENKIHSMNIVSIFGTFDQIWNNEAKAVYSYHEPSTFTVQKDNYVEFEIPAITYLPDTYLPFGQFGLANSGAYQGLDGVYLDGDQYNFINATVDFSTQAKVASSENGIAMYSVNPIDNSPYMLSKAEGYHFAMVHIPVKIDISLNVDENLRESIRLTDIQLRNVPKVYTCTGSHNRTPRPGEDDNEIVNETNYSDYYFEHDDPDNYAPLKMDASASDQTQTSFRYVWYMPPHYGGSYLTLTSTTNSQKNWVLSNVFPEIFPVTHIYITGEYWYDDDWQEFNLTIIPLRERAGWQYSKSLRLPENSHCRITVNLNETFPAPGSDDLRVMYPNYVP